ncbi:hypothetical protein [Paenibacillus assamensis]|uniref:hypothetical protein n=1 Tax=Paenibacillus assamensis TaxID=311244 RepID=UPI00041E891C|nr:hypothetical protein [Paenibacillus assamensis]
MGARLLDAQGSQNASYTPSILVDVTSTPAVFGTLGLDISGAAGAAVGVHLYATVTLTTVTTIPSIVNVSIIRNGSTLVYSSAITTPNPLYTTFDCKVTAFDHDVPATSGYVLYEVRVSGNGSDVNLRRVGPESFTAIAYASP